MVSWEERKDYKFYLCLVYVSLLINCFWGYFILRDTCITYKSPIYLLWGSLLKVFYPSGCTVRKIN